jgi:GWxTD domain-containing protein
VRLQVPALLLVLFPCTALHGQSAAERFALDQLQNSLAAVTDTSRLRSLLHRLDHRPANETADGAAMRTLRMAYVAERLSDAGAPPDDREVRDRLRSLARERDDWPYVWHALARADGRRAARERANPIELGNRVGTGSLERAVEHERRALAADPAFVPAALTLADIALGLRDTAIYPQALAGLQDAERAQANPPVALLLALGQVARAAGEPEQAAGAFARAADSDTGDGRALARLELARTRLALGALPSRTPYFDAAATEDSLVVAGYRADLEPIAADTDLARFDAVHGAERTEFLRRFWTDRDRVELRAEGERLREHYRRLLYARRHFALTISRRFYGGRDAYRSGSEEIDDRGIIYVRHGEPQTRLRPFVFGLMPNETWRYARADGDLLFHFSAGYDGAGGGDLYDYRLVQSVLDLRGAADAPRDQLLLSRDALSPLYSRMLNWGRFGSAKAEGRERAIGQASIDFGTSTDSYELQYAHRLSATANLVAVGERDGLPLAHFVFGIAPPETTSIPDEAGVRYPVRVRIVAFDGAEHAVASLDTALDIRVRRPVAQGQYLIGRAELPLPAGSWTWRAAIEQGDSAGVVLPRDSVRADAGSNLTLSDLALGVEPASATWTPPGGEPVRLTPFELFPVGSELQLYYEVAGTVPGTEYRHEIAVFRTKGQPALPERRPAVTLAVNERAEGSRIRAYRTLQLRGLKAGSYLIEVRLRGPGGSDEVRRRGFRVVKPK